MRNPQQRLIAGLMAGAIEIGLLLVLLFGLAGQATTRVTHALVSIAFPVPQPTPSPKPPPAHHHKASGKASPANKQAKATPVYAPPIVRPTPTIPASPHPGIAAGADNGAALRAGPGGGAGGVGNGTGSGGSGDGEGNGGEDAEWTGGKIRDGDFPSEARKAKAHGTTETEIAVTSDGRPASCRVTRSSGNAQLDATTCRLVMERFGFRPARDDSGRAIAGVVEYDQEWTLAGLE